MVTNPKKYFTCKACGDRKRTRKLSTLRLKLCDECVAESARANFRARVSKSVGALDYTVCRERWFHELIYRQVDANGLSALGLGELTFVDKGQRDEKRLGEYAHLGNRYDLLLKQGKQLVCIEIKRCADEFSIAQVQRYYSTLRKLTTERGEADPIMVIITVQMTPQFVDILDLLKEHGINFRVYQLSSEEFRFVLKEYGNE